MECGTFGLLPCVCVGKNGVCKRSLKTELQENEMEKVIHTQREKFIVQLKSALSNVVAAMHRTHTLHIESNVGKKIMCMCFFFSLY